MHREIEVMLVDAQLSKCWHLFRKFSNTSQHEILRSFMIRYLDPLFLISPNAHIMSKLNCVCSLKLYLEKRLYSVSQSCVVNSLLPTMIMCLS